MKRLLCLGALLSLTACATAPIVVPPAPKEVYITVPGKCPAPPKLPAAPHLDTADLAAKASCQEVKKAAVTSLDKMITAYEVLENIVTVYVNQSPAAAAK